jgi:hypothetical protein
MTPPAKTSSRSLATGPNTLLATMRTTRPPATIQPASGVEISRPVANSTPSWRRDPPRN